MAERLIDRGTVEEYWESGGMLNRDSFNLARRVLSALATEERPGPVGQTSLAQVKNIARFSQVTITPQQRDLYAFLRETGKPEGGDSPPETPGTVSVGVLTDQRLLAEVLLLTGDKTDRASFMNAYPYIFRKTK